MYTENELEISNKSYTNKDFATIYPELLDLVTKLTNKWDPTTSNESDPGVVLLKLAALVADKNNYNIDKNILETFPLSVTQVGNARKLYDMLGYSMHWYKSASTTVRFTYTGSKDLTGNPILIPKWTMITDDNGSVVYTITKAVSLPEKGISEPATAIQGSIHDYEVNGVKDITLDNLDSELRLFFTDTKIPENGIFVVNKGTGFSKDENYWKRVDNLQSAASNQHVYKFGVLPNSNTCYIQFPQDIGKLIENGLNIKYVITLGASGNINANTLTTFHEDISHSTGVVTEDIIITNANSARNGRDPENIDEAYRNYKKTVGTFNTLVTLKDYENAIYTATDDAGTPLVSNVVVSDRTCDINNTTNVVQRTGTSSTLVPFVQEDDRDNPVMDAFDLGLYILDGVDDTYNEYTYNKSFSVSNDLIDVLQNIDDQKCMKHDYIDTKLSPTLTYLYKAFYKLQGKVITYYKVTSVEAQDIENNIRVALYKRYNARNVNFGHPVNYDDVVSTIQNCDTRIKSVILAEPEYILRRMEAGDSTGTFANSKSFFEYSMDDVYGEDDGGLLPILISFLAKMILSGNVLLYQFNKDIDFLFGQTDVKKYSDVKAISSYSEFSSTLTEGGKLTIKGKLAKNLNIQFFAPNLYTQRSFTSYVNYYCCGNNFELELNKYYRLDEGEDIKIEYTDSNNQSVPYTIKAGSIIRFRDAADPDAVLKNRASTIDKEVGGSTLGYSTLTASQLIDELAINEVTFSSSVRIPCIWFTKNKKEVTVGGETLTRYTLFEAGQTEYILEDNEYFIYTNQDRNELAIVGSGTLIKRSNSSIYPAVVMQTSVKSSDIISDGLKAFNNVDEDKGWFSYTQQTYGTLTLQELQIVTLGEGMNFSIVPKDTTKTKVSNEPIEITSGTYFETEDKQESLVTYALGDGAEAPTWRCRSKLNIVVGKDYTLKLSSSDKLALVCSSKGSVDTCSLSYSNGNDIWLEYCTLKSENGNTYDWVCDHFGLTFTIRAQKNDTSWSTTSVTYLTKAGTTTTATVVNNKFTIDSTTYTINYATESVANDGTLTNTFDVSNTCILSNTLIGTAGGENLELSSSTGQPVDFYSYTSAELPKCDQDSKLSVDSGVVTITYDFFREYMLSNDQLKLPFSYKGTVVSTSGKYDDAVKMFLIPVTLHGAATNNIKLYHKDGVNESHVVTLSVVGSNIRTDDFFKYQQTPTNEFSGVCIKDWDLDPTLFNSYDIDSEGETLTINGVEVSLSIQYNNVTHKNDLKIEYTDSPETVVAPSGYFKLGNTWHLYIVATESTPAKIVSLVANDFIQIGPIYVVEGSRKYSDQVQTTAEKLAQSYETTTERVLHAIQEKVTDPNYNFNITYTVPEEDMIDTTTTDDANKNYLFSTTAVFDSNHIMNKYLIPQLITTNDTTIKVASSSITK